MKRIFTDADIYEDEWYQELSCDHKLFWDYICRRAEYGVWKPNFGLAEFQLKIKINPAAALSAFNANGKQRVVVTKNDRWFIVGWVHIQFPTLSEKCPAHKPLFKFYKGQHQYLFDTYVKGIRTPQEIEKEIEKEIEIEGEESPRETPFNQIDAFNELWDVYPARGRLRRSSALRVWCEIAVSRDLATRVQQSAKNYSEHLKANDWKTPQDLGNWLPTWSDWENHVEPEKEPEKALNKNQEKIRRELEEINDDQGPVRPGCRPVRKILPES